MEDIDVWRSAHHYMKRYGDNAAARAAKRAEARLAAGDTEGFQLWQRIVTTIEKIGREGPSKATN